MTDKLLTDAIPFTFQISESTTKDGKRILKGLFHLAETKNANGRVYPAKLLEREMKSIMPAVKERRVLGELDHPDDPKIHLDKASHVITALKMKGKQMYGELEVLSTPHGKILEGLIDSGVKLGISSRGLGSLKSTDEGYSVVQEDYKLLTWDVVPNPSTPSAWLDGASAQEPIVIDARNENVAIKGEKTIFENNTKITTVSEFTNKIDEILGGNNHG